MLGPAPVAVHRFSCSVPILVVRSPSNKQPHVNVGAFGHHRGCNLADSSNKTGRGKIIPGDMIMLCCAFINRRSYDMVKKYRYAEPYQTVLDFIRTQRKRSLRRQECHKEECLWADSSAYR